MYIHGRSILAGRFSCGNCKQRGDVPSQACSHIPLKKGWLTFHPKRAGPRYKKNVWLGSKPRRHPNAGLARQLYSTKPTVSHGCKMRPGPKWCVAWSKTWNLPARFFGDVEPARQRRFKKKRWPGSGCRLFWARPQYLLCHPPQLTKQMEKARYLPMWTVRITRHTPTVPIAISPASYGRKSLSYIGKITSIIACCRNTYRSHTFYPRDSCVVGKLIREGLSYWVLVVVLSDKSM